MTIRWEPLESIEASGPFRPCYSNLKQRSGDENVLSCLNKYKEVGRESPEWRQVTGIIVMCNTRHSRPASWSDITQPNVNQPDHHHTSPPHHLTTSPYTSFRSSHHQTWTSWLWENHLQLGIMIRLRKVILDWNRWQSVRELFTIIVTNPILFARPIIAIIGKLIFCYEGVNYYWNWLNLEFKV